MDAITNGLLKTCAVAFLENLPHLHAAGFVGWDAINSARAGTLQLLQDASTPEDRELLTGLLVRLG